MARMHSRKKGKSGSKRPLVTKAPSWARHSEKEVELLVAKLSKEKHTVSQIGMILRDTYGIPSVKLATEKSISEILKEKQLLPELPEELMALLKKNVLLVKHLEKNKQDMAAKRGMQLTVSKINRLVKYFKRSNKLPLDWKYDINKVKLLTE